MTLILEGKTLAARIAASASEHAARITARRGRPPSLAAVAIDTGRPETLYFDVKGRAFEASGAVFQPHILPPGTTTDDLAAYIRGLNSDPGVDGIYVQYPLPEGIDAQTAYDVIAPWKDVDGASSLQPEPPLYFPATAEAVVQLLSFHNVPLAGQAVLIVPGDPLFATALAALFQQEGAHATVAASATAGIAEADIVVVATGVVNGVSAARMRAGAVAVDVGYYHGGGRGDIAATRADIERLSAYAPPRGAIGPLTVALLVAHTADAAARTAAAGATR